MSTAKIVVVAGGGAGGPYAGGGGGAGSIEYNSALSILAQSYSVTVGSGGVAGRLNTPFPTNGSNSIFSTITAYGGGYGANGGQGGQNILAQSGGSGGGGGSSTFTYNHTPGASAGSGSNVYGGGNSSGPSGNYTSGGGGGAGAVGQATANSSSVANGGIGIANQIQASAIGENSGGTYYLGGGGGGGSYDHASNGGVGGIGGGGHGGKSNVSGSSAGLTSGVVNTGGGGGGGGGNSVNDYGSAGGSGVVIIEFTTSDFNFTYSGIYTTGIDGAYTWVAMKTSGDLVLSVATTTPTVTTQAVSSIANETAIGNGNVTADGGATITERGVCIGVTSNPTTAGTKFTTSGTTGAFTVSMTSLTKNTHYHARAYAINSIGTSYGADVEFDTLNLPNELRDFTNKPGAVYDANKTTVIYAEDMALIKEWIEYLASKI